MSDKECMFFGVSTLSSAMARDEKVSCNNLIDCNEFVAMIVENRQLVTDEPVEFEKYPIEV